MNHNMIIAKCYQHYFLTHAGVWILVNKDYHLKGCMSVKIVRYYITGS